MLQKTWYVGRCSDARVKGRWEDSNALDHCANVQRIPVLHVIPSILVRTRLRVISLSVNDMSLAVKPQTHSVVSDIHIFSTQLLRPPCDMLLVLPTTSTICPTSCLAPRPYEHYPSYDHYPYHSAPRSTVPSYPSHLDLLHKPSAGGSKEHENC